MQKLLLVCCLLLYINTDVFAQYRLPENFMFVNDAEGNPLKVEKDFNQDGRNDLFAIIGKEENIKVFALLSKGKSEYRTLTHDDLDYFDCCAAIFVSRNVITLSTNGMRFFEHYKFRYNKKLNNFELIGYDSESLGNAMNDGSGTRSLNLITGLYLYSIHHVSEDGKDHVEEGRRKIKLPKKYTLTCFHDLLPFIEKLTGS